MTSRQVIVRVLRWSAITIVILAALLAGLRLAAGGAPGRWLVTSQLDGREIGGQTIAIEGLSGDPLSRLHLDRLTLADADGVWLTAEDIRLDWQASSLLFKPYRVRSISAARVEVLRRPAGRDDAPDSDGGLPELPALILGELTVAELALAVPHNRGEHNCSLTFHVLQNISHDFIRGCASDDFAALKAVLNTNPGALSAAPSTLHSGSVVLSPNSPSRAA